MSTMDSTVKVLLQKDKSNVLILTVFVYIEVSEEQRKIIAIL